MQEGGILAGKYRLLKRLGEGGEGSVFLAIHLQTEMFWAIKEIRVSQKEADAFSCHELKMMKSLKNRHLPQIIDVLEQDGCVFLVMEHVRGVSMDRRLKKGRILSFREVRDVAEQVTEALCYLESRKPPVCHLDIKPSNLIRRPDGLIKLVDFGSAWKEKEQMKRMGTDGYAAPEQYRPECSGPDVRTDIYGLGATLYRMASGKTWSASQGGNGIPGCPSELSDLILRCLREEPAQRFQSASALQEGLAAIRRKEKREKGRRQILGALAMACPAAALCMQILPSVLDFSADESWDYEKLIREAGVVSEEESREYYRKAIFLNPGNSGAYLSYLSDAQMDGVFSQEEEDYLRDTLHFVRPGTEQTFEELLEMEPEAYLETALQIGLAYWYASPREDNRRIALGWFQKAVEAAEKKEPGDGMDQEGVKHTGGRTQMEKEKQEASLYLRLGTVLEKIPSSPEEDAVLNAEEYWEDLGQILEISGEETVLEDPLTKLRFCREALRTLTFLSGDLIRAGIDKTEQTGRIRELESLAESVTASPGREELMGQIQEEIRAACASALEAAGNAETETIIGKEEE